MGWPLWFAIWFACAITKARQPLNGPSRKRRDSTGGFARTAAPRSHARVISALVVVVTRGEGLATQGERIRSIALGSC